MKNRNVFIEVFALLVFIFFPTSDLSAQNNRSFALTAENLETVKTVELDKLTWKYKAGDESAWASRGFDDSAWESIEATRITPDSLPAGGWNGRAWFRLNLIVDEKLVDKNLALIAMQSGASEIYLDGELIARFGEISETGDTEYNPNRLPIPIKFETPGEHVFAVRFSAQNLADMSRGTGKWLTRGGINPGFSLAIRDAADLNAVISKYAGDTAMRGGFFFIGFLIALALLHFLLYIFYRVERANLFYSFFAAAFAINMFSGNFRTFGHQGPWATLILSLVSILTLPVTFTVLPAFLLVAFQRPLNKIFWALTLLWTVSTSIYIIFLNEYAVIRILPNIMVGLSFTYSIFLLVSALRQQRSGAWILFGGVFALQLGMLAMLLRQFGVVSFPMDIYFIAELCIILGVPISVSVFLARNFARTNRDLKTQLIEVERLSARQIEQERHAADLRAENERRAKELEEARQLQLSMLPSKVPQLPNLEIAAYMKPATEVGGDYYDFHTGDDGTLTIAIGDATGHGLKAGTVVTATKGLFVNLADAPDIPDTFRQISRSLKAMNLRGLFMALTILKVKNNQVSLSVAGMPSVLIYRKETGKVEEISIRAMPLGSVVMFPYEQAEISVATGDTVVLMSDGFPEMFNSENEMIGFEKAAEVLPQIAGKSAQEIINHLVGVGEKWAGSRAPDDDVTFVVLKAT